MGSAVLTIVDRYGAQVADPLEDGDKHFVMLAVDPDGGPACRMTFRRGEFNKMLALHGQPVDVAVNIKLEEDDE